MDNYYFATKYEESLSIKEKKELGIYYTPKMIVQYILKETLCNHNILSNPQPKIIDLSCGCGNFLLDAYDILYNMIKKNLNEIEKLYGYNYIININNHIIENCLYGTDVDKNAIKILKEELRRKKKNYDKSDNLSTLNDNIVCTDALSYNFGLKFDYIVGNPPYIGHKLLDKEYKKNILNTYNEVYRDKGDLYFCFYKKAIDIIKKDGKIGYITPRYFIESPSGEYLRKFLFENSNMEKIIDLNDINVFKNLGVSPVIIILKQKKYDENYNIKIYKSKDVKGKVKEIHKLEDLLSSKYFEKISINQENLKDNWMLVNDEEKKFFLKIEDKCSYELNDIVMSFQGIITGCDKAFVLKEDDERISNIDKDILKLWIKNKNINSYVISKSRNRLLYSNDIDDIEQYKYIEEHCFLPYKQKLENRRECLKNIRKWYELQWGRDKCLFERKKIMYPYKSKNNKFAIDYNNSYCSADVYSFYIKNEFENKFSLEYLIALLNSDIYDRYFKIMAKKMGNDLYDYYPNKVLKIRIFKDENYREIEYLSQKIILQKTYIEEMRDKRHLQDKDITLNNEIYYLENEINFLENRIRKLIKKSLNL